MTFKVLISVDSRAKAVNIEYKKYILTRGFPVGLFILKERAVMKL